MKQNAHELMERLMRMQWLLNRYFHRNLRDRGVPYSGQGRVLKVLKIKPEIPQKELSEILGMRPQSIGELLSKQLTAVFLSVDLYNASVGLFGKRHLSDGCNSCRIYDAAYYCKNHNTG